MSLLAMLKAHDAAEAAEKSGNVAEAEKHKKAVLKHAADQLAFLKKYDAKEEAEPVSKEDPEYKATLTEYNTAVDVLKVNKALMDEDEDVDQEAIMMASLKLSDAYRKLNKSEKSSDQ